MITKEIAIDQITVLENGTILVREVTSIVEDGAILSSTYHRTSYEVGSDLTDAPMRVQVIAEAMWATL